MRLLVFQTCNVIFGGDRVEAISANTPRSKQQFYNHSTTNANTYGACPVLGYEDGRVRPIQNQQDNQKYGYLDDKVREGPLEDVDDHSLRTQKKMH